MSNVNPQCVKCPVHRCKTRDERVKVPKFCPTENFPELIEESIERMELPENMIINRAWQQMVDKLYVNALGRDRWSWTRVDEIMEYARIRGMKKLGIATCYGLIFESKLLSNILEQYGFEVCSVVCLCGEVDAGDIGLEGPIFCNPIMQALVLNKENTELNIMMGLCLGHDMLFLRHCNAESTTLVVKDQALGHHPITALYLSQTNYRRRFPELK